MTIKQQGGIFGRNPTFNDLTVEGTFIQSGTGTSSFPNVEIEGNLSLVDPVFSSIIFDNKDTGISNGDIFGDIEFVDNDGGSAGVGVTAKIEAEATSPYGASAINFYTSASSGGARTALTKRFSINNQGNLVVVNSGNGIDFSATSGTGTSELFDDYEEGTFTPTITSAGTAPTVTYSNQTGTYTKVGNRVHVDIYISTSAYTAGTGNFRIAGLPFTAASGAAEGGAAPMGFRVNTGAEARLKVEGGLTVCQLISRTSRDTSTGWGNAPSSIWGTANPTILAVSFTYVAA